MTNTQLFAKQELDILAATVPDAIITPFRIEILALCEAFGKSGPSGSEAPLIASAISKVVKKLMLQEPICDVTGHDNEWVDVAREIKAILKQAKSIGIITMLVCTLNGTRKN